MEQIIKLVKSEKKDKKYTAILSSGKKISFGLLGSVTYVEGGSEEKRKAYIARHEGNPREKQLIKSLTISPALLSRYILWGESKNIEKNISILNSLLKNKNK
jgi:Family of unknown function (DUF5754)